jgi:23S rRNA (guanosine2251-2'-O)-methyltransferase
MSKLKRYIYGFHAILARIEKARDSVFAVYVDQKYQQKLLKRSQSFIDVVHQHKIVCHFVDSTYLDQCTQSANHQGVVAQVEMLDLCHSLDEMLHLIDTQKRMAHFILLDEVTDPHNIGACLRVADAAGVDAIILPKHNSAHANATVDKVSSGASLTVPMIHVANLSRAIEALQEARIWVLGTSDKANTNLYQTNLRMPLAWVLGAEGKGVRHLVAQHCDEMLSIPMSGSVNSLNVSVACAVCAFEAVRQRIANPV